MRARSGIIAKPLHRIREPDRIIRRHRHAALPARNLARDVAIPVVATITDKDDRPPRGNGAIELAWYDQAFQRGLEGDQMHSRQRDAVLQLCRWLGGLEQHIGKTTARGLLLQAFLLVALADDEKHNLQAMAQSPAC